MKLIAISLLLLPLSVAAKTGNELVAECKADSNPTSFGFCIGYLQGASEAQTMADFMTRIEGGETKGVPHGNLFCLPKNVTVGQIKSIFLKHAEAGPEFLHLEAAFLVNNALAAAFPCQPASSTGQKK